MVERHSSKLVTLVQIQKEIFMIKFFVGRAYFGNASTAAQKTNKKSTKNGGGRTVETHPHSHSGALAALAHRCAEKYSNNSVLFNYTKL